MNASHKYCTCAERNIALWGTCAQCGSARPHMSQIHNNHTGTKEITCVLSKRLPSHSTDSNHDEVLWEVSHAQNQNQPPQHTRSAPVCIPSKPLYGRCNFPTLHLALTHLENKDSYVRMLFIDFSSAFNTIIPQQLINKLNLLGLNNSLCNWILDFLTGRPQSVRVGHNTSSTTTLVPQKLFLFQLILKDYHESISCYWFKWCKWRTGVNIGKQFNVTISIWHISHGI